MELKTAKIIIGRKELCDVYKGNQVEVQAQILKTASSAAIDKGVAKVLDNVMKGQYCGRRRVKNDHN